MRGELAETGSLHPSCSAQSCVGSSPGAGVAPQGRRTVNSLTSWRKEGTWAHQRPALVTGAWTAVRVCGAWAPVFGGP